MQSSASDETCCNYFFLSLIFPKALHCVYGGGLVSDMTFEILHGGSLAGSKLFQTVVALWWGLLLPSVFFCAKQPNQVHTLHQLQAHILNTDLVNYNLRSELFKTLTLSLMPSNVKADHMQKHI